MNTEEAIKWLKSRTLNIKFLKGAAVKWFTKNNKSVDEIIDLLKQGEKYEQIWGELVNRSFDLDSEQWDEMEVVRDITFNLEQKYFPKEVK